MPSNFHFPDKIGLSVRETCHATSFGRTTIFKMLADPNCPLKAVKIGGRTIILADSIRALFEGEA